MRALLAFRPEIAPLFGALTNELLHAPNTLGPGERELIGAYVSSLNACTSCYTSHAAIAAWTPDDPESYRQRARFVVERGYAASLSPGQGSQ